MAPLRSLNSLRRYVGTADDWRQAVWNRWLISYLMPRDEGDEAASARGAGAPRDRAPAGADGPRAATETMPSEEPKSAERLRAGERPEEAARGADEVASDPVSSFRDVRESLRAASPLGASSQHPSSQEALPLGASSQHPASPGGVGTCGAARLPDEVGAVERRQLAARARLEALSEQMFSVEEGLDALGQRLQIREVTERRSTQRMMELIERVVEAAERQSEALERSIATLERVERRLARLDRWVRPSGVESVPPPPVPSTVTPMNGHGGHPEVRVALGDEPPPVAPRVPSMNGSLSDMSVATLLSMFELERRTGWLIVEGERERVRFELLDGAVVRGRIGDRAEDPLEVLRAAIGWRVGTFSFCPVAVVAGPYPARSVGAMLLEASHQNDEAVRIVG